MKSFLIALQFMSRIQLAKQTVWTSEDFGRSVMYYPLVGVVIGLVLTAVYVLCSYILTGFYLAAVVIAAWFFITGGLHADGFMDTADGIFSGRSRERMLEIMKDSRVGSNGVIAYFWLALLKICFLANIPASFVPLALIGIPAAVRFGTLISIFEFPYGRSQGLGKIFREYAPSHTMAIGFVLALLPALYGGFLYLTILGSAMVVSLAANRYMETVLGGVTGDTYGAVCEGNELIMLAVAAILGHLFC
ncbi:MAG: adenosylcobinamide-GDP ribazoletransferase [Megasphaera sp.]|jgi:adenosylcobinamide-GDP ribazoletransferase|nr:adenosylcobinamide-GDP ribazoletransferase [Megasphaera sp.]MCH4218315.1 adenosylcobinamide-GDP ribazoletransferase [Megasphaera sp.]